MLCYPHKATGSLHVHTWSSQVCSTEVCCCQGYHCHLALTWLPLTDLTFLVSFWLPNLNLQPAIFSPSLSTSCHSLVIPSLLSFLPQSSSLLFSPILSPFPSPMFDSFPSHFPSHSLLDPSPPSLPSTPTTTKRIYSARQYTNLAQRSEVRGKTFVDDSLGVSFSSGSNKCKFIHYSPLYVCRWRITFIVNYAPPYGLLLSHTHQLCALSSSSDIISCPVGHAWLTTQTNMGW